MNLDNVLEPTMAESDMPLMQFEPICDQSSHIKVIGVGGGGGNAVNHMYRQGITGVDFIVCNTDMKALNDSPVPKKIELGKLGAGNVPEIARKAALDHKDEIREAISNNTKMLFITAGMGGGTGTGAAPVIAEIAKSIELEDEEVPRILVVAIVTTPFSFEGRRRKQQAEAGIEELKKHVDSILVINNDKLRTLGNLPLNHAFSQADEVLLTAAKGIAEIITVSAYVNIDFRDVNTVMANSGTALMGSGMGRGENRAHDAIVAATTSSLLNDNDIRGAKNILLYFSYSPNHQITMDELGEVTDFIAGLTGNMDSDVIWGAGDDESLNDELSITLIATGFEQKPGSVVIDLGKEEQKIKEEASKKEETPATVEEPHAEGEPFVIHKSEAAPAAETVTAPAEPVKPEIADVHVEEVQGRRVFHLDEPMESEQQTSNLTDVAVEEPVEEEKEHNYLDDIRVVSRRTAEPLRAAEQPAPYEQKVEPVEVFDRVETQVKNDINKAFTPEPIMDDVSVRNKAERIRLMHDLLRNNPNGPMMIEKLTTEQLTGEPIADMPNSAVSDAARMVVTPNGRVVSTNSFLENLPD